MRNYNLEKRKFVIGGVAVAIVIGYIVQLFALQIMNDEYKKNADSNAFLNKVQYPARGAIYDRQGWISVARWASAKSSSSSAWPTSRTGP